MPFYMNISSMKCIKQEKNLDLLNWKMKFIFYEDLLRTRVQIAPGQGAKGDHRKLGLSLCAVPYVAHCSFISERQRDSCGIIVLVLTYLDMY